MPGILSSVPYVASSYTPLKMVSAVASVEGKRWLDGSLFLPTFGTATAAATTEGGEAKSPGLLL